MTPATRRPVGATTDGPSVSDAIVMGEPPSTASMPWGSSRGPGMPGPGKAGQLLAAGDDVVAAIRRVVRTLGLPTRTVTDCVARLPVERV